MNRQTVIDLLAAGRVANLPSVVSNVVLGAVVFGVFGRVIWPAAAFGCLVGMLLYLGGCFLNDWWDRNWDREHKPERAIPSNRVKSGLLLGLSIVCFVTGLGLAVTLGPIGMGVSFVIVLLILLYSFIHKRTSLGVIPMGLCRFCLYFLGFVAANPEFQLGEVIGRISSDSEVFRDWVLVLVCPAVGLLLYIAGLSLLARFEARGNLPRTNQVLAYFLLFLPALTHSVGPGVHQPLLTTLAALPFLGSVWVATRLIKKSIGAGVSLLLATIPLLDFVLVLPLVAIGWAGIRYSDDVVEKAGASEEFYKGLELSNDFSALAPALVPLVAFVLARYLQKIAPAT